MYIGETIRTIRLNKNIKSGVAYKGIFSRSVASNFEKGLADTTVHKFLHILDNLYISLEEFEAFYNNKENKNSYYTNGYIDAYYNQNIEKLQQLIENASIDYKETGNEKYNHLKALMSLLLSDLSKEINNNDSVSILQHYLVNCNTWSYYEVTLFTNSLQFYSDELIDIVYSHASKVLQHSPRKSRYQNDLTILLCNILEVKILSKNTNSIQYYLMELQRNVSSTLESTYSKIMLKYLTAIINYTHDIKYEETIIMILDALDCLELQIVKNLCATFYYKVQRVYWN